MAHQTATTRTAPSARCDSRPRDSFPPSWRPLDRPAGAVAHRLTPRRLAWVVVVTAMIGVLLCWAFFVDTVTGQHLDRLALQGAKYGRGHLWHVAEPILNIVSWTFVAVGIAVAVTIAALRRRWWLTAQIVVVVLGANVTTQGLKRVVFERENLIDEWYRWPNTLPSGHTTVAGTMAVALLLAVPRSWRPAVAVLGGAFTAAMGISTLIGQWHRPSDVVAAILVVLAWASAACAMTPESARDHTSPTPGSRRVAGMLWALGGIALVATTACLAVVSPADWSASETLKIVAHVGGVFSVVAVTAIAFAILLPLRQATARAGQPAVHPRSAHP